jgi:integrase
VLSGEELAAIWRTAEGRFGAILRLLIATGCRKREIGDLQRSEVAADSRTINIPGERMKGGKPHTVWLPDYAWNVLASAMLAGDGDYIFGRGGRSGYGDWSRAKAAVDERLGQSIMGPWVVHDVRRSVASGMGDIGVQPHIVECILAHRSGFRAGVGPKYHEPRPARQRVSEQMGQPTSPQEMSVSGNGHQPHHETAPLLRLMR